MVGPLIVSTPATLGASESRSVHSGSSAMATDTSRMMAITRSTFSV